MESLKNKRVALYITGGIAAYKGAYVARSLMKAGAKVRVAMTRAAQEFVTPLTFKALTHNEVLTELFTDEKTAVPHIELADWSELALVVPTTADLMAKLAHGIADDLVSTALLATAAPIYLVPAMNEKMWEASATQRNYRQLCTDGVKILMPKDGYLAEGYTGKGRMPEPEEIMAWLATELTSNADLKGKRVLVSAGGTLEPIDPVRYIANRSSGKMGYALANAANARGAQVTLVTTKSDLPVPRGIQVEKVVTAAEMEAVLLKHFPTADITIMAAAVADYRVAQISSQKIKKKNETWELKLLKNPDILKHLGQIKRADQYLVGFAAETDELLKNATDKLLAKNVDLLVANDVSRSDIGFGADENQVLLLRPQKDVKTTPKVTKERLAHKILDEVLSSSK
ncbi:bifunctional phosphopantothenoylcysteine decarboxylase/phosphopantothenate--cysteine ligase CoaBC [Ligilactobacillus faecis]|uniref:Coenzyme A biosynthesis bifunctional protein CoaBC n=1 Tax=Ligilactobacillus faecis TaxID=762833 RepID=A0ABV4DPT2_9LACO